MCAVKEARFLEVIRETVLFDEAEEVKDSLCYSLHKKCSHFDLMYPEI